MTPIADSAKAHIDAIRRPLLVMTISCSSGNCFQIWDGEVRMSLTVMNFIAGTSVRAESTPLSPGCQRIWLPRTGQTQLGRYCFPTAARRR